MKQALQLRLGQQLTMTPQLQQAIRLLQLSTLELRMEVQQALESNLMLETEEELDLLQESERDEDDPFEAETEAEASEELDLARGAPGRHRVGRHLRQHPDAQ
jgi:RNA polymerase sigma-54 factor